jgi:LacI family transcriptional regulator
VQLLAQAPKTTAIFALNDLMARGALMTLESSGYAVPDDISVAGFDDLPVAEDTKPQLTTLHLPLEDIGARAMRMVLEPATEKRRTERIVGEVVRRGSTGPVSKRKR